MKEKVERSIREAKDKGRSDGGGKEEIDRGNYQEKERRRLLTRNSPRSRLNQVLYPHT